MSFQQVEFEIQNLQTFQDMNYLDRLSFIKNHEFDILRDCRYGEVCNGRQRCESDSSLSIKESLGIDFFKEAVSRSMRIKKRSVRNVEEYQHRN